MTTWNTMNIPPQHGRSAIVTGTGGLGFETALALAKAGGDVVLAGRSAEKGRASVARIKAAIPSAQIAFERLDLASLASVEAFSDRILGARRRLDLLVNNAGVMTPPTWQTTSDGFELQFGTNYLGHFALTARLLPLLQQGHAPRVVNLSSLAHRSGVIRFDDLHRGRSYKPWASYAQSKLAMLMFALELQRRSDAAGWGLMSNAAHPGYARTDLIPNGPGKDAFLSKLNLLVQPLISHSAADGALPTLFAATSPDAAGAAYYGPDWFFELKGPPKRAKIAAAAQDEDVAARLWDVSEQLTGVAMPTGMAIGRESVRGRMPVLTP
ncbi:SDR family oxidoreductase [Acidisoma cladoniae]|jgi:NAD(P)-dependent dehydrogenase (short-subunit alcohol dehydrogenase family)|uniref:SDR family oxidoreductase n=1 Tax=Acidisoma cladoniae TaxID=3040935 RepID=UPI00254E3861|nr:SDR family oxidoreductase [Acidisoma sp. PAMC 29798]